jgi:hypothetical protein
MTRSPALLKLGPQEAVIHEMEKVNSGSRFYESEEQAVQAADSL